MSQRLILGLRIDCAERSGCITGSVVTLNIVAPHGAYALAVRALQPVAFYELNETNNPAGHECPGL